MTESPNSYFMHYTHAKQRQKNYFYNVYSLQKCGLTLQIRSSFRKRRWSVKELDYKSQKRNLWYLQINVLFKSIISGRLDPLYFRNLEWYSQEFLYLKYKLWLLLNRYNHINYKGIKNIINIIGGYWKCVLLNYVTQSFYETEVILSGIGHGNAGICLENQRTL